MINEKLTAAKDPGSDRGILDVDFEVIDRAAFPQGIKKKHIFPEYYRSMPITVDDAIRQIKRKYLG